MLRDHLLSTQKNLSCKQTIRGNHSRVVQIERMWFHSKTNLLSLPSYIIVYCAIGHRFPIRDMGRIRLGVCEKKNNL